MHVRPLLRSAFLSCVALGWLAGPGQAESAAGKGPVVVELYTSQGCSSCPKADRLLQTMTDRADVLPLALHVDYWDYLGWRDEFGDPRYSKRQKAYARFAGRDMIYTPQMVVMGEEDVVGAHADELSQLIRAHHGAAAEAVVSAVRTGDGLTVDIAPLDGMRAGAGFDVQFVAYEPLRQASTIADARTVRACPCGSTPKPPAICRGP